MASVNKGDRSVGRNVQLKPGERIDQLCSEDMTIIQSAEVFSFSLDALLLADFAKVSPRDDRRVIDFCAGNGAVTLLLAARTKSPVLGVELQPRLAEMATRSAQLNGMQTQVTFKTADIRTLGEADIPSDSVDVITCNPPYFLGEKGGGVNPNEHLAIARHELYLPLAELVHQVGRLLKKRGKFYMVHRPERWLDITRIFAENRLTLKAVRPIYPKAGKEANMLLIEAAKDGSEQGFKWLPPLVVHGADGQYLPEVRRVIYGANN